MSQTKIDLHLSEPEMTLIHRAGLAGLYMTLKALESVRDRPGNLTWDLTSRQVSLSWDGQDFKVLDWLLKQSFRIEEHGEKEGLIALTGLEPETLDLQNQITIHQGIRGTFLQHPSTFKSDGTVVKVIQVDEGAPFKVQYQKAKSYAHQEFAKTLCNDKGELLKQPLSIAGWLNPGAVVRHVAFSGQTGFEETPKHALVLLFAPIACQYFLLRSRLRDKRAQYALVIPEVTNLESYAERRKDFRTIGYEDFHASSLGDAGLRFLTYEETINTLETQRIPSCQVVTLGTVAWSSQQKTRTDLEVIEADAKVCVVYQHARNCLPPRKVEGKEGSFIAPSFACEIVAENLARNRPWYEGLAELINSGERFKLLTYEREGLHNMVQIMDETIEKLFVKACHEALSRTYKKIYDYAERKGEIANIDRENERIRTSLGRCKNPETFRQFITDFWSRAGQVPTLQDHWQELLTLATDQRSWRKAKDLTLLALASYKGKGKPASSAEEQPDYD
jgi:CRISPR-associated protein Cas8a1/Csx13